MLISTTIESLSLPIAVITINIITILSNTEVDNRIPAETKLLEVDKIYIDRTIKMENPQTEIPDEVRIEVE